MTSPRFSSFFVRHSVAVAILATSAVSPLIAALPAPDPDNGGLELAPGFRALVVADNLMTGRQKGDALRFLAVTPQGNLYAKTSLGGIIALQDKDGDGRFEQKTEFGSGGGTGIGLRGEWLYHSTNDAVYRYALKSGELVPSGAQETVVKGLPDARQHNAKSFAFGGDGQLYVEVGSPSNAYGNPDRSYMPPGTPSADPTEFLKTHGGFWRFNPDQLNQTQADGYHFSTGHRHVLAIAWNRPAETFYVVQMGRDQMNVVAPEYYDALDNAERVSEVMHRLPDGANLGWPYTYWDPIKKARMQAPEFGGDNRKRAEPGKYEDPVIAFPAHWAPLQMAFYTGTQFPAKYENGAFIAFHGSWNRAPLPQEGFNIAFVPFDAKGKALGDYEMFARNSSGTRFRMGGVAVGPDGSLFISETDRGRIWRIIYTGEANPVVATTARPLAPGAINPAKTADSIGKTLYSQVCATCHMADGSGAGRMQPALKGNPALAGDAAQLIAVVLKGSPALPANRQKYENIMPAFATLTDAQIADVVTYVRQAFGGGSSSVTPAQVATQRAKQP